MVYVVVESPRVRSRGNKHHHKRAFLGLVVRFLDPLRQLSPVGRIAKHPFTPQFWERPSSALVKCSAHFAFSCVQHGSRSKWNSASSSSKRACGVAHSTDALENKQLFFCNESLHHIQHTWQRHAVPPHLVSRAVASVYAVLPPIREALQSATLKRRKPPDKVAPRLF